MGVIEKFTYPGKIKVLKNSKLKDPNISFHPSMKSQYESLSLVYKQLIYDVGSFRFVRHDKNVGEASLVSTRKQLTAKATPSSVCVHLAAF